MLVKDTRRQAGGGGSNPEKWARPEWGGATFLGDGVRRKGQERTWMSSYMGGRILKQCLVLSLLCPESGKC